MDVCLVNMPYANLPVPSLALGLLQGALQQAGITAEVVYANLDFAAKVGIKPYIQIENAPRKLLAGEFVFARAAFGDDEELDRRYYTLCTGKAEAIPAILSGFADSMRAAREVAADFVEQTAAAIVAKKPKIVGCSSLFTQNCASLALLRAVKRLSPAIITVMGGNNCEGEAGLAMVEAFDWLDFVFSGEADDSFPMFCQLVLAKGSKVSDEELPYGVLRRGLIKDKQPVPRRVVADLNQVPIPDYHDYFQALHASGLQQAINPGLLFESARGCWWGEKKPCTFCGLNGHAYKFRMKSCERVMAELAEQAQEYQIRSFEAVDNILAREHLATVIPALAAADKPYQVFYETKSNLTKEQLASLVKAGIRWIQPGIESLHDGPLKLMNKGNTAIKHIEFLKHANELGIRCSWNLLWGFPGEQAEWYAEMAVWLELITHLQPPGGFCHIFFDRNSSYTNEPAAYGLSLRPVSAISLIYPELPGFIEKITHIYDVVSHNRDAEQDNKRITAVKQAAEITGSWYKSFWSASRDLLYMRDTGKQLEIVDLRSCAVNLLYSLTGIEKAVYQTCGRVIYRKKLLQVIRENQAMAYSEAQINEVIDKLKANKLLLEIHDQLLALAVSADRPPLPDWQDFPGGYVR